MKRLTTLILGIGLLAAACGTNRAGSLGSAPSGSPTPTQSPSASPSPSPSRTPSPSGRKLTYRVWFLDHGKLFVTKRTEPFAPTVAGIALTGVLGGPNPAE